MFPVAEINLFCTGDAVKERTRIVVDEGKSISLIGILVIRLHGILEAACLADDGDRPVAHGNQLRQAAGLKETGHKQRIRAGINLVSQCLVVGDIGADFALILALIVPEGILIIRITGAQDDYLRVLIHNMVQDRIHQIQTFLIGQTGDESDHHLVFILIKSEFFLKCPLVDFLLLHHIRRCVGCRQQLIRFAVPLLHINSIDDAHQLAGMIPQMIIQALPVEGGLNLFGIRLTDRRDAVGKSQAAFHHVGIIGSLLHVRIVENLTRNICPVLHVRNPTDSLEPQVMDRQDALRLTDRCRGKVCPQIDRDKGRLPVMAVDNIRRPFKVVHDRQRCFGKIAEFRNVCEQIRIGIAPAEEFLVLNEVIDYPIHDELHNPDKELTSALAEIHHKGAAVYHLLLILLRNTGIFRQEHANLAVQPDECTWQRIHDIPKAAGLDKRITLRSHKCNFPLRALIILFFHPTLSLLNRLFSLILPELLSIEYTKFSTKTSAGPIFIPGLPLFLPHLTPGKLPDKQAKTPSGLCRI